MPGVPGVPVQAGLGRGGPLGPAPTRAQARQARGPSMSMVEPTLEEEEDVSRGDMLDFLTPREISKMRYEQHHEWMEEIVDSPYSINQIVPVELGLGRKGALEELTNGFFTAPTSAIHEPSDGPPARVGRMDQGKAEQFRRKAEDKLASMTAELEQMKKDHARRMAVLEKSSVYMTAERRLRNAVEDPTTANQALRLERSRQGNEVPSGPLEKVADIVAEVESRSNRMAIPISEITCIEKGGLEEKPEEAPQPEKAPSRSPSAASAVQVDEQMLNVQEQILPQETSPLPTTQEQPTMEKPKSPLPDPITAAPVAETATVTESEPSHPDQAGEVAGENNAVPSAGETGLDVDMEMDGLENEGAADGHVDDWVMVNEENNTEAHPGLGAEPQTDVPASAESAQPATTTPGFANTPGSGIQGLTPVEGDSGAQGGEDSGIDAGNFEIEGNFENIDTAGEAMDSYGAGDEDLDLGDLDNSAFGEAFHPADHGEQPEEHDEV